MFRMLLVSTLLSFSMMASAQGTTAGSQDQENAEVQQSDHQARHGGKKYRGKKGHHRCDTDECKAKREEWRKKRENMTDEERAEMRKKRQEHRANRAHDHQHRNADSE